MSLCTRYGLVIGAKAAPLVHVLMWLFAVVAWPVSKLLEFILGGHHGIIYRRAELKELVNLHSAAQLHGGDLDKDTAEIIGHTLDLQEKVARDAMQPIGRVFMLPLSTCLDTETLRTICRMGHSRVPVYEDVEWREDGESKRARKIVGVLLVKLCVLLDPDGAFLLLLLLV